MNDVLHQIVARTKARLDAETFDRQATLRAARQHADGREAFAFSAALKRAGRVNVIAEIKAASPSAGTIVENPNIEQIAADYKRGGAAAISIVTEPDFFRGSREWIVRASAASGLPVIMKDFVIDPSQLLRGAAAGASAVLLLASLLDAAQIREFITILDDFGCDALVEVHDETELARAVDGGARLIGVNNRDLRTFHVDLGTSERLATLIPAGVVKVAVGSSRVDLQACKLEYSIVSPK